MKIKLPALILFTFLAINIYSQDSPYFISFPRFENNHWLFTGESDTMIGNWTYASPLQKPLLGMNSYFRADSNTIFLCGGIDSSGITQTNCYSYNTGNNSYSPKASLPIGRWSGKLVRVRDSLYLVGSIDSNFSAPDGKIYRYSINTNSWQLKSTMPSPFVQECAAFVFNDSLIITIGGSADRFVGSTTLIRLYNPWVNSWYTSLSTYPVSTTAAHAEFNILDTTVTVVGGFGNVINDIVYQGVVRFNHSDSLSITWINSSTTPFNGGIYRESGGKWNDLMLFGPGLKLTTVSEIYGLKIVDSVFYWIRFLPNMIDTTANIPQIAVKPGADTTNFYFFGGANYLKFTSNVKYLSVYGQPPPIGINPVSENVPKSFKLYQNYPNPFNPVTKIKFEITGNKPQEVRLVIYDILGRNLETFIQKSLRPGSYEYTFDAGKYASGLYFYSLISGEGFDVKKMVFVK